jgi:desulfoferrodoxin-like iron-binding protein
MISEDQIYKCSVCGNVIKVLIAGGGELICCNKPMDLEEVITGEAEPKFLGDEDLANIDSDDLTNIDSEDEDDDDDEYDEEMN